MVENTSFIEEDEAAATAELGFLPRFLPADLVTGEPLFLSVW